MCCCVLQCLCQCLEFQFDTVIADRVMILQRLRLLASTLPTQPILTWDFFLNRFDTLSLEAQLDLESNGDIQYPTGMSSTLSHFTHIVPYKVCSKVCFSLLLTCWTWYKMSLVCVRLGLSLSVMCVVIQGFRSLGKSIHVLHSNFYQKCIIYIKSNLNNTWRICIARTYFSL